jgi:hypothetical protein
MNADARIKGPVLLEAIFVSIPIYSHAGTRIIAPPIPSKPPVKPPENPRIMAFFKKDVDILSDSFSNL